MTEKGMKRLFTSSSRFSQQGLAVQGKIAAGRRRPNASLQAAAGAYGICFCEFPEP
jgi:hypothetical protein